MARIWSQAPIFEYVKKELFWLIFYRYGFLISMKKLKNRLLGKKRKTYLYEKVEKSTFEVTCSKMIHIFQVKNMRRFVILVGQSVFDTSKFHEKSWILCIKIFTVKKKVDEKTTFPKSPICNWTSIFWIFEKKFFFVIFFSNVHFKKKLLSFFWKLFYNKIRNTSRTILFWLFWIFCEKCIFNPKRSVFVFQKNKNEQKCKLNSRMEGGRKVHFSKSSFGLLVVKPKPNFFHNRYRRLSVNFHKLHFWTWNELFNCFFTDCIVRH